MANESLTMQVRAALKAISGAGVPPRDLIAGGAIADIAVSPAGVARISLTAAAGDADALRPAIEAAAGAIDGVARVVVVAPPTAGGHANPLGLQRQKKEPVAPLLPGVKRVIAVASGKGGVGKSTVAVNLAVALSRRGRRVGLLDGDIHGPSTPTLLGTTGARPTLIEGRLQPLEAHGLKTLSIGNLVDAEKALAWRGPMVMGALRQLMTDVDWGDLDILLIDTPPGTGDVHLSLGQTKRLDGAVIVSTPQELALADVRRGVAFFRQVNVPILGIIENMAWLEGPNGERLDIFGTGGAERAAKELEAPFLGALPLMPSLRIAGDEGTPAGGGVASDAAAAFDRLAKVVDGEG